MAVSIPNVQAVRTNRAPSGMQGIARVDTRGANEGFEQAAGILREEATRRHRNQLSKAEADYMILQSEQDSAAAQDNEYATMEERYTGTMTEGMGAIAANIGDAQARAEFVNRHRVDIARGKERVKGIAWGKERDYERGQLTEYLKTVREAGLNSDIGMANDVATGLIQSAAEMDWLTEQERADMTGAFRKDLALGKINMMEPEQQLEAVGRPWAKNLPADVRDAIKKKAIAKMTASKEKMEEDVLVNKAHSTALSLQSKPRGEAMVSIAKIKDREEREETYRQNDYLRSKTKLADAEEQKGLYEKYADGIQENPDEPLDIEEDDWETMETGVRENLRRLQLSYVKKRSSDPNVIYVLQLLRARAKTDPRAWVELNNYFIKNSGELSETDRKTWGAIDAEGNAPIEVDNKLSDQQQLAAVLTGPQNSVARAKMHGDLGVWRTKYVQNHNKQPDDVARDAAIVRIMGDYYAKRTTSVLGMEISLPDLDGTYYNMDAEDRETMKTAMKEENPSRYQEILNLFTGRGISPTDAQIMDMFTKMRAADDAVK